MPDWGLSEMNFGTFRNNVHDLHSMIQVLQLCVDIPLTADGHDSEAEYEEVNELKQPDVNTTTLCTPQRNSPIFSWG